MSECDICAVKFTKVLRKEISCPSCEKVACSNCYKQYFLTLATDAKCMFCSVAFNPEFLRNNFVKNYIEKDYRTHRETILVAREKSYLPETQAKLEEEKAAYEARQEAYAKELELTNRITSLRLKISATRKKNSKLSGQELKASRELNEARKAKVCKLFQKLEESQMINMGYIKAPKEKVKPKMNRLCPNEECRGFLSEDWHCSLCEKDTCKKCFTIKEDDHECKKDDIETAKEMKKNTKPCPKCGVPIFKIEGCSQMFCTSCHTAFDWNTLAVETGLIHNPHYFEYQKSKGALGRQPGDIPCGGLPQNIRTLLSTRFNMVLENILRKAIHFSDIRTRLQNRLERDTERLRISYLKKLIDEEEWKRKLFLTEKEFQRNNAFNNIKSMFVLVSNDLFHRIEVDTKENAKETFMEIVKLVEYYNLQCRKVSETYNYQYRDYIGFDLLSWFISDFEQSLNSKNYKKTLKQARKILMDDNAARIARF